ncbi:MAG: archaeosortase/exosortase family protein [Bdellovibrionales bacterium]|nr:archaeosortase/exosortase family protein [Bdellovibrionales bacterium]
MLLFFACLPLSYHIETFLGFPLRLASAKIAEAFFSVTSHQVHSTETILLVENKLAHIDLPCSGIKSLWSISLFSLLLSLVEKYKINMAWILAFVGSWLLVASANIFRIIMLVFVYGSDLPETAKDSLHVPIGLIGFLVACIATYWIFRELAQKAEPASDAYTNGFSYKAIGIITSILIFAISINQIKPAKAIEENSLKTYQEAKDSLPLTDKEKDLFLRHGVIAFQKKKFDIEGIRGTSFLVLSKSWRGHHHPEQCLQGQGLLIESTKTLVIEDKLQIRDVGIKIPRLKSSTGSKQSTTQLMTIHLGFGLASFIRTSPTPWSAFILKMELLQILLHSKI